MSKWTKKIWMLGIWAGIGVLVGMQLAGSGAASPGSEQKQAVTASVSNGQKPASPSAQEQARQSSNKFKAGEKQDADQQVEVKNWSEKTPEQILVQNDSKPTVDVLADKTAGLLQQLSQKGIRLVVSLFSSVTE